jgi:hypothetical protein
MLLSSKDRGQYIVVASREGYVLNCIGNPKNWLKGHGNETDLREFKAKIKKLESCLRDLVSNRFIKKIGKSLSCHVTLI